MDCMEYLQIASNLITLKKIKMEHKQVSIFQKETKLQFLSKFKKRNFYFHQKTQRKKQK